MQLLPYRRYELVSAKTQWEVEAAMRAAVEPKRFFGFGAPPRPFEGEVGDGTFDVQRAISYRNSFLPQIRGKISAAPGGSRIAVTMRLHPFVLVFMTIWLGGVGASCLLVLATELRKGDSALAVGPAIMFVFGWALATGSFNFEANKADTLLATTMVARSSADAVQPRVAADEAAPRR
jgi:hypothetical protein